MTPPSPRRAPRRPRHLVAACLLALLACTTDTAAQQKLPPLSIATQKLPPLSIATWYGPSLPQPARHRYLLIDFWAPWCTVCMQTLPHVNALAARYRDRGLAVLCLAVRDTEARVRAVVERTPFAAHVAFDEDDRTWNAFALSAIPAVFIADSSGNLRWRGHPSDLTDAFIEHLLATDSIYVAPEQRQAVPMHFSISLTPPADPNDRTTSFGRTRALHVRKRSVPPAALVNTALAGMNVPPSDIEWFGTPPALPLMDMLLEADSIVPRSIAFSLALQYICTAFGLEHRTRTERLPVLSLAVGDAALLSARRITPMPDDLPGRRNDGDTVTFQAIPLDLLHQYLAALLDERVAPMDLGGGGSATAGARYTFRVRRGDADAVARQLRACCGIELRRTPHDVVIHTITRKEPPR